ncbi:MAG: hypothetical protein GF330_04830 [Candidatus Eisenbacteria bacterium]|nr:hypothetical protein [Candidatus Eisenbacteria bacterium]
MRFTQLPNAPRETERWILALLTLVLVLAASGAPAAHAGGDRVPVNGEILEQELYYEQGYTVLRVWGSHYEMGYAHGYLMADWLQLAYEQFTATFGAYWTMARQLVADWTFLPACCEDEFAGLVDGLHARIPASTMDVTDAKVASTIGDWLYAAACRSTCCWDELVDSPYTTLAMRKLQFMTFPPQITQQWHHVICAWEPSDGSPRWVNFGFGGYVSAVTAVNEYGTLASLHDWNSDQGPNHPEALPRTMACRYVLTMDLEPDPLTHLATAFDALQPHEAATGGFLNYYVPDGGAGVIKHSKSAGYYDTRAPQPAWMDAHVISTNNSDIDGTYGISPWAPYYNSLDPDQGTLATLDGLWATGYQSSDMHMVAQGYAGPEEMTFWFEGRLQGGTTGRIELTWRDLFRDPGAIEEEAEDRLADRLRPEDRIRVRPSPAIARAGLVQLEVPARAFAGDAPQRVLLCDATGRRVRELTQPARRGGDDPGAGTLLFYWDGADDAGVPVQPGIYLFRAPRGQTGGRVVWLGR